MTKHIANGKKIKESLDMIEKMIEDADDNLEQGVPCSSEKIEVLEATKKILGS